MNIVSFQKLSFPVHIVCLQYVIIDIFVNNVVAFYSKVHIYLGIRMGLIPPSIIPRNRLV